MENTAHTPITFLLVVTLLITAGSMTAIITNRISDLQQQQYHDTEAVIGHIERLADLMDTPAKPEGRYTPLALEMAEEIANVNRTLPYRDAIRFGEAIEQASEHYNLDPRVILGVILAESTAKPGAKNGSCFGPMQVNVRFWDKPLREAGHINGNSDYFKILNGVMAGSYVLDHYLGKHNGDLDGALDAYSGGAKNYAQKVYKFGGIES